VPVLCLQLLLLMVFYLVTVSASCWHFGFLSGIKCYWLLMLGFWLVHAVTGLLMAGLCLLICFWVIYSAGALVRASVGVWPLVDILGSSPLIM
jgi:uncharacterized membrane protein